MATFSGEGTTTGPTDGGSAARDLYAEAAALARKRFFQEALDTVTTAVAQGDCSQAEALDLEARMLVQRGQLLEAEICWKRALALDGANLAYADALARLRRRPASFGGVLLAAGTAVAIVGLAVLSGLVLVEAGRHSRQIEVLTGALVRSEAKQADARAALESRIAATMSSTASASANQLGEIKASLASLAPAAELEALKQRLAEAKAASAALIGELRAGLTESDAVSRQALEATGREMSQRIERIGGRFDEASASLQALKAELERLRAVSGTGLESLRTMQSEAGRLRAETATRFGELQEQIERGRADQSATTQTVQADLERTRTAVDQAMQFFSILTCALPQEVHPK